MTVGNRAVSRDEPVITTSRSPLHRAAGTGAMYLGPGDVYRFLVTGRRRPGTAWSFSSTAILAPRSPEP